MLTLTKGSFGAVNEMVPHYCTIILFFYFSTTICHYAFVLCLIICFFSFLFFFSFELVKSMLPAEHHKVLANIRKAEARTKRRKQAAEQQDDSESEEEAPKAKSKR